MTLAPLSTADARLPGSRYGGHTIQTEGGGALTCYGEPGDRCQCGALLSKYNPRDACNCCGGGAKRKRRTSASADGAVVTSAAPESCRVSQEAIEVAARTRQTTKQISDAVRQYAETHQWNAYFTAKDCATVVGCGESTAKKRLTRLVESGLLESSPRLGYARRQRGGIVKDSPADSQSSDNAPEPLREQTPDASAPDSAGPALQASPASGGVYQGDKDYQQYTAASSDDIAEAMRRTSNFDSEAMTVDWFRPPAPRLTEAAVIGWFEDAGRVERRRVLDYLLERW